MQILIPIPPRTKKNHSRIVMRRGRPKALPSKQYEEFERNSAEFLLPYRLLNIDYPINLKCLFYQDADRKSDLTGYLQAMQDTLVHYGILQDDNHKIVVSTDGSRVYLDRNNPRVEIEIERVKIYDN